LLNFVQVELTVPKTPIRWTDRANTTNWWTCWPRGCSGFGTSLSGYKSALERFSIVG